MTDTIEDIPLARFRLVTSNQRPPIALVAGGSSSGISGYAIPANKRHVQIQATWDGTDSVDLSPMMSTTAAIRSEAINELSSWFPRRTRSTSQFQGDYEILDELGRGGMGVVYLARQNHLDREVALKVLLKASAHDRNSSKNQVNKFLVEACITAELMHANIIPVHEIGVFEDGDIFIAMKRVRGTGWDHTIGNLSQAENLDIFLKVCDAVAMAHSRKIIHRDIKPENVHLEAYGEVLLMDWGLAVPTDGRAINGIKIELSMGGTPAYMAPEMATGPLNRISHHSDIYLLGAILYEIVTGKPPHTGKDVMKCLFAAAKNNIQPTEETGELVDIAMRCMATDPNDRFESVFALQDAIRTFMSHTESIALSVRAEEDLNRAKSTGNYQDYSRALFGFEEAVELWEGNTVAAQSVPRVRLLFGREANKKEDYDLALQILNSNDPGHAEALVQAKKGLRERDQRKGRLRLLRWTGFLILIFFFIAVLCTTLYVVHLAKEREYWRKKALELESRKAIHTDVNTGKEFKV